MTDNALVRSDQLVKRAAQVKAQIDRIRGNLVDSFYELAELLAEARRFEFNLDWGYPRFGDWVEEGSGLDISERTAYYMIAVIEKSKELGIPRSELRQSKVSKLKEIFTLDPKTQGDRMKQLVADSATETLEQVKLKVNQIKAAAGDEIFVTKTITFTQDGYENTVKPGAERIRLEYGDSYDPRTNEAVEISLGRCIELVFADKLAEPDLYEVIDAEEIPAE